MGVKLKFRARIQLLYAHAKTFTNVFEVRILGGGASGNTQGFALVFLTAPWYKKYDFLEKNWYLDSII